jgi:hypothetical protein
MLSQPLLLPTSTGKDSQSLSTSFLLTSNYNYCNLQLLTDCDLPAGQLSPEEWTEDSSESLGLQAEYQYDWDYICAEKEYILSNLLAMMHKAQDHGAGVEFSAPPQCTHQP